MYRRNAGITLIEILIAMSILAILSVLGYKAFSNLLISRERLMDTSRQWVELARVFRRMESDIARLPTAAGLDEARRWGENRRMVPLSLKQEGNKGQLLLNVYSSRNRSGMETLRYRWDASGLSWSVAYPDAVPSGPHALFPAGYGVHWRLMMPDGSYRDNWPPATTREWPRALEMRVVLPDGSAVTRLWEVP